MSDNEDLLGDDLGDQSLADYNLGNEEEEQLLADDYENGPQNVPNTVAPYRSLDLPAEYTPHVADYNTQPLPYQPLLEPECVVPNITVEIPNTPVPERPTYAPYEARYDIVEHAVPPAIPAVPIESPQIVPTDVAAPMPNTPVANNVHNGADGGLVVPRERFVAERPSGPRMPQVRDIPDTLDKVIIPRGGYPGRGRTSWRNPQFSARFNSHPYRRNNMHRGNFNQRPSFPPPHVRHSPPQMRPEMRPDMRPIMRPPIRPEMRPIRPEIRPEGRPQLRPEIQEMRPEMGPDMRPEIRPEMRLELHPEMRHDIHHEMRPDIGPDMRPDMHPEARLVRINMHPDRPDMRPDMPPELRPDMRPEIHMEIRHDLRPDMPDMRPEMEMRPQLRPDMSPERPIHLGPEISPERPILPQDVLMFRPLERPPFPNYRFPFRPNMEERPFRPNFDPRPVYFRPNFPRFGPVREIAPNSLNHMPQVTIRQPMPMPEKDMPKGREPEVRMLPVSLPPTLPPGGLAGKKVLINPHFKGNFQPPVDGPVKDINDAAERFIAEQRNALARAATRKFARRSPQRYIENTTIEIENELAHGPPPRAHDDELSRRQEEFINANRAGLRRRMRSPSPPRRSPSPPGPPAGPRRRSPGPRRPPAHSDEESEYKRKVREQETLRERVLRAKELRRRRNAVAMHARVADRDRDIQEKDKENTEQPKVEVRPEPLRPSSAEKDVKPDTTRTTPERPPVVDNKEILAEKTVEKKEKLAEKIRERSPVKREASPEVNSTLESCTPPRPPRRDSDDDLDLILGDIDGILSDDDDEARFKDAHKTEPPKSKPSVDLRSKLPPKSAEQTADKRQRQKIIFADDKKKEKPLAPLAAPARAEASSEPGDRNAAKTKQKAEAASLKSRQRITFDNKEAEREDDKKPTAFSNRRVILQRKITPAKEKSVFSRIEVKSDRDRDPTKPNPGIFSRAVRTAIAAQKEPEVEFESGSEADEERLLDGESGSSACVRNLPFGITDTRLRTLAGPDVQTLTLDKEERSAKITFKTTIAAENFKKKFNNKMVAASRLTVTLR